MLKERGYGMEVRYSKDNTIRGIFITYNEKERDSIMKLKSFFNYHLQQIKVRTTDGRYCYVNIMDIYYIESLDGRCLIYDKTKIYFALDRFQNYKTGLRRQGFVQCNKTQIVNTYHMRDIEIYKDCQRIITLDNEEILLVSRRYKQDIDQYKQKLRLF